MADTPAAALIVALGGYMVGVFGRDFYLSSASTHWPKTKAEVQGSSVTVVGLGQRPVNLEGAAYVRYEYEVRGRSYYGNRIHYGPAWWWWAWRETRRYPPGAIIEVAYDPRRPARAVIRPGLTWSTVLALPAGAAVLVAGVTWLVRSLLAP